MVGVCITLVPNFYAIVGGRILYGTSVGLLAVCTARLMEETLPLNIISMMGALYCVSFPFATMVADLMASILPPDDNKEELIKT